MQIPYVSPLAASLAFIQFLLLYLRFDEAHDVEDSHWGLMLIPTFVAEFFLVAILASEALVEGGAKERKNITKNEASDTSLSYILMEMVVSVLILLTTALYVFFLDDDTDLPLYWITTTFFGATVLFFATTVVMCKTTIERARLGELKYRIEPYETVHQSGARTVFVGLLVMLQGLLLWLYTSPWGQLLNTSLFWVTLPSILLLVASFVINVHQTYFRRNNPGPNLIRQGTFIFMILLMFVTLILLIVHLDYGLIPNPKWIILPLLIYSGIMIPVSLYIYYSLRPTTPVSATSAPPEDVYSPTAQTSDVYYYPSGPVAAGKPLASPWQPERFLPYNQGHS